MGIDDARARLNSLLGFLEQDPENANLLRDAADAAIEADDPSVANGLFLKLQTIETLSVGDVNQAGIVAMRSGDQQRAQQLFGALLEERPDDNALKFNRAWSLALAKDFDGAQAQLDEATVDMLPQAAMLDLQLRHERGDFDGAEKLAHDYLAIHSDYPPLLAAISVLAMDIENIELARECAVKAGDHPDALTTLATLSLGEQNNDEAHQMFERALAKNPHSPRAWVGLGLSDMARGKSEDAVANLDRGAEMFATHLGSWIAAGWGYFLAGDLPSARKRFETALAIDDTFGESHGSLAVLDLLEGHHDSGQRHIEIARRLDRESFSLALAQMLIASSDGDNEKAKRIFEIALKQPLDASGRTLSDALGSMAMGRA